MDTLQIFAVQMLMSFIGAYYIPTFVVPALLVSHAMIFAMLVTRAR